MAEIIPPNDPPVPDPAPAPAPGAGRTIVCECCGSKLDRRGGLLRRGDLAKQMIEAEDTINGLRKQLAKAADDLQNARKDLDDARAQIKPQRSSLWQREA